MIIRRENSQTVVALEGASELDTIMLAVEARGNRHRLRRRRHWRIASRLGDALRDHEAVHSIEGKDADLALAALEWYMVEGRDSDDYTHLRPALFKVAEHMLAATQVHHAESP